MTLLFQIWKHVLVFSENMLQEVQKRVHLSTCRWVLIAKY